MNTDARKANCKNCGHSVLVSDGQVHHLNEDFIDGRGHHTSLVSEECTAKGCECKLPEVLM